MKKEAIIGTIFAIVIIVGTAFAMSDRFIFKATFTEFKEHVIYRLDNIDRKLEQLLGERG